MVEIGDVRKNNLAELSKRLRHYRERHFDVGSANVDSRIPNVFGGCGGRLEEILEEYVALQMRKENEETSASGGLQNQQLRSTG
ncbi:MAG: hypothetical protein H8E40_06445 [Chloroflexi bacterium]|nr:hypothetical protein [Chloroflexota bacterium]